MQRKHLVETFGANNDDVPVWKLVGLEPSVVIQTSVAHEQSPSQRWQ